MSWICPTCEREVPLWESECSHCEIAPAQEGTQPEHEHQHEPAAAAPEAAPAEVAAALPEEVSAPTAGDNEEAPVETISREEIPSIRSGSPGRARVPWAAYLVMGLGVTALVILLWPSAQTSLRVLSEPPGAVVWLDGKRVAQAPLELTGLKDGYSYTLRAELDGYEPFEQTFVAHAQEKPWTITLERSHDPLLDEDVIGELVGQIGASGREGLFSHELAEALFTVNPLIEQNPWLTERTWSEIFQQVVKTNFDGNSEEFLHHLRAYKAELARGKTTKQAWYQHLHACEKVCRPIVTEVFKRHIAWLNRSGFSVVYFPMSQYKLTEEDTAAISHFLAEHNLVRDRSRQLLLVGRASRIGGQQYNLELSRKRVQSVTEAIAAQLPDGRARLRLVHLGFEPPQITPSVAKFLGLDASRTQAQHNQSVMLIASEPIAASSSAAG